jgi:hypothetical protein
MGPGAVCCDRDRARPRRRRKAHAVPEREAEIAPGSEQFAAGGSIDKGMFRFKLQFIDGGFGCLGRDPASNQTGDDFGNIDAVDKGAIENLKYPLLTWLA